MLCLTRFWPWVGGRAAALRSGRRPRARPCLCRRPSVPNRRLPGLRPLPPTHARSTSEVAPVDPRPTEDPVIYSGFCAQCSKTSCFTVFRALRRPRILSWRCSKTVVFTFFTWFRASGKGKNRKSWHLEGVST